MGYLGEDIPKLGFGLMRLPRLEDGQTIDVAQTKEMVDLFMEAGCTYFDTARAYGESESATREALVERYPRESFQLATKNAAWIGSKTAEEARADFDVSLEKTGAGYFDYYLIHNTGDARTEVFDRLDLWSFVEQLKADGRVRHIGFSHHDNADVLEQIIEAHPSMEFVQLQVNWADWENPNTQSRRCVEVAARHGLPVIVMEPVRGGTLANPPEAVARILREANPGRTYADWALRFAMGVPGIITVLSGMSNVQQMRENLQTWRTFEPLSEDERAVLARAQRTLDELLAVPCTSCHYCEKDCPMEINVSAVMTSLNRTALYGAEHGGNWYRFGTSDGHRAGDCIQCGSCEAACPQHIDVMAQLEEASRLFD